MSGNAQRLADKATRCVYCNGVIGGRHLVATDDPSRHESCQGHPRTELEPGGYPRTGEAVRRRTARSFEQGLIIAVAGGAISIEFPTETITTTRASLARLPYRRQTIWRMDHADL